MEKCLYPGGRKVSGMVLPWCCTGSWDGKNSEERKHLIPPLVEEFEVVRLNDRSNT